MGPLEGLRIIELQGIGPGPFCGMMLADMGAEVIRVDRPGAAGGVARSQRFNILARGRGPIRRNLKPGQVLMCCCAWSKNVMD